MLRCLVIDVTGGYRPVGGGAGIDDVRALFIAKLEDLLKLRLHGLS